jgi:hypothetical protein
MRPKPIDSLSEAMWLWLVSQSELPLHRDSLSGGRKATASLLVATPSADSESGRSDPLRSPPPYGRLAITRLPNNCRRQHKPDHCGRSFAGNHQTPCPRITALLSAPQYLTGCRTLCLPARLYALLLTAFTWSSLRAPKPTCHIAYYNPNWNADEAK